MSDHTSTDPTTTDRSGDATTSRRVPVDPAGPYVLGRDEGEHFHFLNHLATRKVTAGERGALTAVEFVQDRGFGPPLHRHADEDEILVVLEGEIAFRSGEDEFVGAAGSTAFLPHGVPHTFQVLSESARCLAICASRERSPRFDRMVAALGEPTPRPTVPAPVEIDPGHVAEVNAAHGIEILGPPPAPLPA
ncbi:cupin domain-containing protein [Ilumatobacter sp.]|uniref:cupin domain-containing protein n=1 Tax=Ilumatobacter sp. TaxID=1967498 RepID=UPI003B516AD0